MSTLRGHDKEKQKEKEREREREKEREKKESQREEESSHSPPPTPTLLSAKRKEEAGNLHDLKAVLVQLRNIKQVSYLVCKSTC